MSTWRRGGESATDGACAVAFEQPALRGHLLAPGVLLLLLAACTSAISGGSVLTAGTTSVFVGAPADNGADALLSGPLAVVSGCLGVGDHVVVWPHGTVLVASRPVTIRIPHFGTFAVGDQVAIGGASSPETAAGHPPGTAFDAAGVTVPASCARHDVWVTGSLAK